MPPIRARLLHVPTPLALHLLSLVIPRSPPDIKKGDFRKEHPPKVALNGHQTVIGYSVPRPTLPASPRFEPLASPQRGPSSASLVFSRGLRREPYPTSPFSEQGAPPFGRALRCKGGHRGSPCVCLSPVFHSLSEKHEAIAVRVTTSHYSAHPNQPQSEGALLGGGIIY